MINLLQITNQHQEDPFYKHFNDDKHFFFCFALKDKDLP